jgi:DNA polymerase-1
MANKWLQALKSIQNTTAALREEGTDAPQAGAEKAKTPEKPLAKIAKNNETPTKPKKRAKKKKVLIPEEEEAHRAALAEKFPAYVYTEQRAREVLEWVRGVSEVSIDIETHGRIKQEGLLYTKCQVRLIQFAAGGKTYFLDCNHVPDEITREILEALKGKPLYFHSALFDIPRLYRRFGVLLDEGIHDTMLVSRVARAGEWERKKGRVVQKSHSMDDCLKRELGIEIPKDRKLKWGGLITEDHLHYAGDDVAHLKALHIALQDVLEHNGVKERYDAIQAGIPDFVGATVRGIPLDAERLRPILDSLEEEVEDLRARLDELAPEHPEGNGWIWGNTSKEVGPDGKGRNGALRALSLLGVKLGDVQDQTLLDHRESHEIVGLLYTYRKKANTLSRYRRWIPDFYEDGRLYPQPKVAAAVTGRVLYSDPNAQGIDKKRTDEFRRCVRAPEGRAIVKGDFAQQELRIAAYFSKDVAMTEAFKNGDDIYLKTAAKLVGEERAQEARAAAKRATLGFLYGLGVDKYRTNVYKDTGEPLSAEQAIKDRQAFRAAFPTFYNWQRTYGTRKEWETWSVLGWRRVVSPQKGRDGNTVPRYTERLNGPIQSTAGDILYLTLARMADDPFPGTHFLLSVHDELVLECPEENARSVALWLRGKMRGAIEEVLGKGLGGKESVEVGYGPSWGECKDIDNATV